MQRLYIQTTEGLRAVTLEVTRDNIIDALGYTPMDGTQFFEDESGALVLADSKGNIIARITADGMETTKISAKSIMLDGESLIDKFSKINSGASNVELTKESIIEALGYTPMDGAQFFEDESGALILADENENVICRINGEGLEVTSINAKHIMLDGESLADKLSQFQGGGGTSGDLSNYVTKDDLQQSITEVKEVLPTIDAKSIVVDTQKKWLRVTEEDAEGNTKSYFLQLTELVKPNAPTIATVTYNIVTGNATIAITAVTDTTTEYKVDSGSWTTGTSITIASGFSNSANNSTKTATVVVRSVKNGEYSDEKTYTITIKPKVAAGTVSVTRTPNNNNWATKAVVALSPSATTGAKSEYSKDSGSSWTEFTSKVEFTETTTQSANKYQVRATKSNYVNSDTTKNSAFTLNALKAYYGASAKTTLTKDDILALVNTGGSSEAKKLAVGNYTIKPTTTSYVWICTTDATPYSTIVNNKGDIIPFGFEDAVTVDGWKCYRSSNTINSNTNIYIPS